MYLGAKTVKYLLYSISLVCVVLGILLIWYGDWLLETIKDMKINHGENLAAILAILLGVVVIIMAVFGFLAIFKESNSMLTAYAVILVLLLIIQLILVSISYTVASGNLSIGLKESFDELWDDVNNTNSTLSRYEEWLECCGKHGAEDYFLLDKIPPSSCCKAYDCTNILNLYVIGCDQKFKQYISTKTSKFNAISWFLIVVEILGSVLACNLVDKLRNHRDRIRFYN